MFDQLIIDSRPQTVYSQTTTTVTEKRAPTDEAVKLLREMERAAFDNLLSRQNLEINGIKTVVSTFRDPYNLGLDGLFVVIQYDFNGQSDYVKIELDYRVAKSDRPRVVFERFSEHLSAKMLQSTPSSVVREILG
jgi:hypothetical protein